MYCIENKYFIDFDATPEFQALISKVETVSELKIIPTVNNGKCCGKLLYRYKKFDTKVSPTISVYDIPTNEYLFLHIECSFIGHDVNKSHKLWISIKEIKT
jgi:hypothetical protein